MIPQTSTTGEYVDYDDPEYTCDFEYVYDVEPKSSYSRNETKTSNDGEYVYDCDAGEYVLEKTRKTSNSNPKSTVAPRNNKPGHKKTVPDLYDELDYELSPRIEVGKKEGISKQKKIIFVSVLGVCLVGAVVTGVVFVNQGRYFFTFEWMGLELARIITIIQLIDIKWAN